MTGKADWLAAGLPTVRADSSERRAIDVVDRDPATCAPTDSVGHVAPAIEAHGTVFVVGSGVLHGRIRAKQIAGVDPATVVEEVMELGPSTARADEPLVALLERLASAHAHEIAVTTPEGRLLGVVRVDDDRGPAVQ